MVTTNSAKVRRVPDWDWDRPMRVTPAKPARAVVSVAFSGKEFERVSAAAETAGKRVSTFIRERALRGAR